MPLKRDEIWLFLTRRNNVNIYSTMVNIMHYHVHEKKKSLFSRTQEKSKIHKHLLKLIIKLIPSAFRIRKNPIITARTTIDHDSSDELRHCVMNPKLNNDEIFYFSSLH